MALSKARKQRPNFPALPSARAMALGKDLFLKKEKISLPSARVWHSAKNFQKKKKNYLPSAAEVALVKEAVRVDVGFFFAEC